MALDNALSQALHLRFPIWQAPLPFALFSAAQSGKISASGALGLLCVHESSNCQQLNHALAQYHEQHSQAAICFMHRLPQAPSWQASHEQQEHIHRFCQKHQLSYPLSHSDHFLDLLDSAINASPRLIGFANGIPEKETIQLIKSQAIRTFAICHNLPEALTAADFGVDYLVLQGSEAGGEQCRFENDLPELRHSGLSLLQQVRAHLSLPLVLWSDFTHGADIVAALIAGAQAVMLDRPLLQCFLPEAQLQHLQAQTEYDSRLDARFTNRVLRYFSPEGTLPNLHHLDPMLRQVLMTHYFAHYPERTPLCLSASENRLPTQLNELLAALQEQMRQYIG